MTDGRGSASAVSRARIAVLTVLRLTAADTTVNAVGVDPRVAAYREGDDEKEREE